MKRFHLILSISALLLIPVSFAAGSVVTTSQLATDCEASLHPIPAVQAVDPPALPELDAPGADIVELPRYPGAVRVEYRQTYKDSLVVTEVEYVVSAELEPIHDFYRNVFDKGGWSVADLGFYQGEWTFFVIAGSREALVEIEARGSLVEVEIELSEP